ncbi:trypsin-like peptidase domain-containing protein [Tumidithrix elongata RA019]|uniref:Trypsin-like peptidase domain-containing protein n=1 Tax=Tumidithrix elongata BACA0141 TaxID=2716417 RepID=A0AAW9Q7D8_9CYAN|nr:trypsin-like peptidase domain-containing protein [Tumidithrix elongata RA019]
MKRGFVSIIATSLMLFGGAIGTTGAILTAAPKPIQAQDIDEETNIRVYKAASPAVVSIRSASGNGSGSIIDAKGLVLTSAHVVKGSNTVTVTLANKQKLQGQVIASSRNPDLALIRLQGVTSDLPTIKIGYSSQIQVGQRAFAIGDPFGRFAGTLTTGIVSRIDTDRNLIQTDAALNPGNSGGPLLNGRGELIGVNTSIYTSGEHEGNIGLGFAITADTVREFMAAAQQGRIANNNPVKQPPTTLLLNGAAIASTLTAQDETLPDGSLYKVFQFEGQARQRVVLEMRSTDIDPYLALFDANGNKIAEDDDSGGGKNARITITLPRTGRYTLYANSYEPGDSGRFTLSARVSDYQTPTATDFSDPPSNSQSAILLQRNGTLGAGSRVFARDGSLFDTFSFAGTAGQIVKITLSSQDFHPYLVIFSPDRQVLKENNGLPDRKNAAITLELPFTGTYRVVANAFDRSGRGNYSLTVQRLR